MRRLLAGLLAVTLLTVSACTDDPPKADDVAAAPTGPSCLPAPASPSPAAPPSPSGGAAGKPLPAMAVRCFDGGRYVDAALLGSAPTILNLWGSYCEPCRTELPAFQRFVTAADGRLRVVGVVVRDSRDAAQSVIDDKRLTFPMLEDRDQQFSVALGRVVGKPVANALPATLFIAPGGRVVYTYQGDALDEQKIRALTATHLGIEVAA
ncbi:TlpA family protein disulfide reductase [Dactylosporangium aurantiacum]|uniref:TlpA family protein disulfide reductase n=1 Tax=Dactylosporangium aurantiacum TaxID=35754 RepID=A0A9Q9MMY3_9ACTN|nr:TlpA disulfide reductase family protein [Dactylosporangium aurantiacum]MDG6100735.1 TlpA disulfide reductase family protein [Dactylosporangium aurantiacum]UWZ55197.1 TlpA family protein disulfide reductase [Dactylosporangium aurantiacum]